MDDLGHHLRGLCVEKSEQPRHIKPSQNSLAAVLIMFVTTAVIPALTQVREVREIWNYHDLFMTLKPKSPLYESSLLIVCSFIMWHLIWFQHKSSLCKEWAPFRTLKQNTASFGSKWADYCEIDTVTFIAIMVFCNSKGLSTWSLANGFRNLAQIDFGGKGATLWNATFLWVFVESKISFIKGLRKYTQAYNMWFLGIGWPCCCCCCC